MSANPHIDRVEIHDNVHEWWFRVVAPNGEIVATGELYASKQKCVEEAEKLFPGSEMIEKSHLRR